MPLGYPADIVTGMGRGSFTDPHAGTRYGLTWRLTVYTAATATPAATAISTASLGPSPTSTATPGLTPSSTPTPKPAPASYLFNGYAVPSCLPQAAGTWFEGKAYLHGQPADGYRVVFSGTPDGTWITAPAITGPTPDKPWDDHGHYSHIIRPAASGQPLAGDWYVWIVDQTGARISVVAKWRSTGPGPTGQGCNQAVVNFAG
jgi:hypothetical protein